MTRREALLSVASGVTAATGAQQTMVADDTWPTFARGPARTGYTADDIGPKKSLASAWRVETDRPVLSPALAGGMIYFGSYDGSCYALDATDGNELWRTSLESRGVVGSPTVVNKTVYLLGRGTPESGSLYALNKETGAKRWQTELGTTIVDNTPAVVDGTAYVGDGDGVVHALDASDGTERWRYRADDEVTTAPAVASGTVYIGSWDESVYALDAADGAEHWVFESEAVIDGAPAVANETVYVGSSDSQVYALDADSGTTRWTTDVDAAVRGSPAVGGGTVYVGAGSAIVALDAATGRQQWMFNTGSQISSAPVVAGSTVYIGSRETTLYALDPETGREYAAFNPGNVLTPADQDRISRGEAAAVGDGQVYVPTSNGQLYALGTSGEDTFLSDLTTLGIAGGLTVGVGAWLYRRKQRSR
mgnify:CR=1 FL=1